MNPSLDSNCVGIPRIQRQRTSCPFVSFSMTLPYRNPTKKRLVAITLRETNVRPDESAIDLHSRTEVIYRLRQRVGVKLIEVAISEAHVLYRLGITRGRRELCRRSEPQRQIQLADYVRGCSFLQQKPRLSVVVVAGRPTLDLSSGLDQPDRYADVVTVTPNAAFYQVVDIEFLPNLMGARVSTLEAHRRTSGNYPQIGRVGDSELRAEFFRQAIGELRHRLCTQLFEGQNDKDGQGNLYVSDTTGGAIWIIRNFMRGSSQHHFGWPRIWVQDPQLLGTGFFGAFGEPFPLGANGIAFSHVSHSKGEILAGDSDKGPAGAITSSSASRVAGGHSSRPCALPDSAA